MKSDQHTPEVQVVSAMANHPLVTLGAALAPAYWWDPFDTQGPTAISA